MDEKELADIGESGARDEILRVYGEWYKFLKPDGNRWQSEDDVWDCWIAYAGSETEARRVCQSMEAVLRPLPARLS